VKRQEEKRRRGEKKKEKKRTIHLPSMITAAQVYVE